MQSSMKRGFAKVEAARAPRSRFDLTETHKTTFDGGRLIPFYWNYFNPSEVVKCRTKAFIRMSSPLDTPVMDNYTLTVHWYKVAIRNLWTNFRKFFGEQTDPGDSIDYTVPTLTGSQTVQTGDIGQYMGLRLGTAPNTITGISALPFRAYSFIYNHWYRDENLIDSVNQPTDDGPDSAVEAHFDDEPFRRGKRFDLVTSALPWPQKGDAVSVPLGTQADIYTQGVAGNIVAIGDDANPGDSLRLNGLNPTQFVAGTTENPNLYADLSNASAATINELRNAFAIQQFLERDARGGTRFPEQILSHFGTVFNEGSYAPVFVGGSSRPMTINPIPDQAGTIGELSGIGTGVFDGASFTCSFDEPSILMGIACVDADLTYQHALERKFSYSTRYDFLWPEFVNIGEQAMLNKEVFMDTTGANNDDVWGYVPRYEEMRHGFNKITGKFSSDASTPIDSWHLAEEFASLPSLNQSFIESDPPFDRVMQITTEPHFLADFRTELYATRPLPMYGTPGLRRL